MTTVTPPSHEESKDFDLSNESYYLLLALGPLGKDGNIDYHTGG